MTTSVNIGIFSVVINVVLCRVVIEEPQRGWTYTENSGETITMTCNADCVNSTCAYLWSVSDNITHGTTTLDTFRIGNFPRKDGLYVVECTVTNVGYGTTGKCTQTVNVHYPPDVTLTEENNTLHCAAKGNPPKYKYIYWIHTLNNVDLRRLDGSQRLDVSLDYQNRGTYQCAVSNDVGQDQTASVYVSRNAKPMVLGDNYVNKDVSKGGNFNTVFNIYGYPEDVWVILHKKDNSVTGPLSYVERRQTKNDVNVKFYEQPVPVTGTRLELNIRRMKEEWFGEYDVVIGNTEGNTTAKVTITPKGPPDMPKFNLLEMSHDSAVFKLTSGFYNGANQTLVIQFRPHIKGSKWSNGSRENVGTEKNRTVVLRVQGLKPETTYVFRAYSYNMFSESDDIRITRTTKEEPSNLAIIVGACAGAVVILVVIAGVVIAVIVVRKKRRKKSVPRMLPKLDMPSILANSEPNLETPTPDIYENTGKSAMLYKNNDGDLYENTNAKTESSTSSVQTPENNYANVPLFVGASFKSNQGQKKIAEQPVIYTNTNGMHGIAEARAAASADAESLADKPDPLGYITLDSQHTAEIPDEDYLDMEVTTPIKKSASVSTPSSFNYITPTSLGRSLTSTKKMPEMKKEDSMELYMDMDEERRDSVPDYRAPPPPVPLPHTDTAGDDYVNLRKKGKQPF